VSMRAARRVPAARPPGADAYRRAFVRAVHEVLRLAVSRLVPARLSRLQEPEITGLLVEKMREVVKGRLCPRNAEHFSVHDDPPLKRGRRLGKRRPRVDIAIERAAPGPRPWFQFEAKRLKTPRHVAAFLGRDGLGCFVSGRYGADLRDVGMLGYVQARTVSEWAFEIGQRIESSRSLHRVPTGDPAWTARVIGSALPDTFHSMHVRARHGLVDVFHTLFRCY
jgi:hypothetical protein